MAKFRKHFRKGNKFNDKHPTYIFSENKKDYEYLSLTHSKTTQRKNNVELDVNPNKKDNRKAYVRPIPLRSSKSSFGSVLKGWFFGLEDKKKIDKIINHKNKRK